MSSNSYYSFWRIEGKKSHHQNLSEQLRKYLLKWKEMLGIGSTGRKEGGKEGKKDEKQRNRKARKEALYRINHSPECLLSSASNSVQFSRSVVSDSLWPHESQHATPPCPSPTPRVHSDSRPSNQWCHPAISSSVVPFSSCPQSLPALLAWGGQSTGVSALASFLPEKSQGWFPSEWTG